MLFGIILVGAILRQNNEPVAAPKVANPQGGVRTATPWARFTPPEGGFSIDLPGSALAYVQDTTLGGTSIRVRHFSALGSANTVTVSYADLLPDTEALGDERRIEGFAAEQANEMGAVATNSRPSVVDGHKTLDYTIAAKGAGTSMSRVILVGNRIYNIAIIGTSPKAEYFVKATSSFAIG